MSAGEESLAMMLNAYGVPFEREYRFAPPRRWRADFALHNHKILVEVEGGVYVKGRHTTGQGFERDCEKTNKAVQLGWKVLRYSTGMVTSGEAINQIMEMIGERGERP